MMKPYGADRLVDGTITERELEGIIRNKYDDPVVVLDAYMMMECQRIADGSFTPIDGFCTKAEMDTIMHESSLLSGVFFPIPIFFQLSCDGGNKQQCTAGGQEIQEGFKGDILLKDVNNDVVGLIEKAECFTYDLEKLSQYIFGTSGQKHPGVARLFSKGSHFIGGKLKIKEVNNDLSQYCLSPVESRKKIEENRWQTCVGFQTRNVPHLAHEYLQKTVMEIFDGVLIHPVIGWKKKDDYMPAVVIGTYQYLIDHIYPRAKAMLSGLQIQMRYAGPKEAVFHAIVRQNYGCSHFIVGRDHAGVGSYYGTYEAHEMAEQVQEKLDIQILRMKGPRYCDRCRSIVTDNICAHKEAYIREVSGTIIREKISAGEYPPDEFIRREIVDEIMKHQEIFVR